MEKFLVLTTTTEQILATRTCELLEDSGIPVMLEHIEILDGNTRAHGYRLLVPSQYSQTALRLVDVASNAYYFAESRNIH